MRIFEANLPFESASRKARGGRELSTQRKHLKVMQNLISSMDSKNVFTLFKSHILLVLGDG